MRLFPSASPLRLITCGSLAVVALAALTGCHSHYVSMDVRNDSGKPITLVEVDYPSASFGADALAAGATYHYRFKILGDGPTKLLWTDAAEHNHTVPGPSLHEGQEGTLDATITATTATWQSSLRSN
jgi:hypothetical protein